MIQLEVLHRVQNRDEFIHGRLDELADSDDGKPFLLKDNVVSLRTEVKHG